MSGHGGQGQDVAGLVSSEACSLASGGRLLVSADDLPSWRDRALVSIYVGASEVELGPTLMTSCSPHSLSKTLAPNIVTFGGEGH